MSSLAGKTLFITGASRGIGRAVTAEVQAKYTKMAQQTRHL